MFLEETINALSFRSLGLAVLALLMLSLISGASVISRADRHISGLLLVLHSIGFAMVEVVLINSNDDYDTPTYPPFLIVVTSALGFWLSRHLHRKQRIPDWAHSLLSAAYGSKLSALFIDEPRDLFHSLLVFATVTPALLSSQRPVSKPRAPLLVAIQASAVVVTLWIAKPTVLRHLITFLYGRAPSATESFTTYLCAVSVALLPLSVRYARSKLTKRVNSVVCLLSFLFAVVEPDLELITWARSDIFDTNYSQGGTSTATPGWASWLVFVLFSLWVLYFSSVVKLSRPALATLSGGLLGVYSCAAFLPPHGSIALYCVMVALFEVWAWLILLHQETAAERTPMRSELSSSCWFLLALMEGLFLFLFFAVAPLFFTQRNGVNGLLQARNILLTLHAGMNFLVSLLYHLHSSIAGGLGRHPEAKGRQAGKSAWHMRQQALRNAFTSGSSMWRQQLNNVAVVVTFVELCLLNSSILDLAEVELLPLCAVFLLLEPDSLLLSHLNGERRYVPMLLAAVMLLLFSASWDVVLLPAMVQFHLSVGDGEVDFWFCMKNMALMLLLLPALQKSSNFLWTLQHDSQIILASVGPLCLLPLIFADLVSVQLLALGSIIGKLAAQTWESDIDGLFVHMYYGLRTLKGSLVQYLR